MVPTSKVASVLGRSFLESGELWVVGWKEQREGCSKSNLPGETLESAVSKCSSSVFSGELSVYKVVNLSEWGQSRPRSFGKLASSWNTPNRFNVGCSPVLSEYVWRCCLCIQTRSAVVSLGDGPDVYLCGTVSVFVCVSAWDTQIVGLRQKIQSVRPVKCSSTTSCLCFFAFQHRFLYFTPCWDDIQVFWIISTPLLPLLDDCGGVIDLGFPTIRPCCSLTCMS